MITLIISQSLDHLVRMAGLPGTMCPATLSPMEHFNIVDEGGGPGGWHETTLRLTCLNPMGQFRVMHTA